MAEEGGLEVEWLGDRTEVGWCIDTVGRVHIGLDIFWYAGGNFGRDAPCRHTPSTGALLKLWTLGTGLGALAVPPAA